MAPNNKLDRHEREARGRVRGYQARQAVHERQTTRRRRDNLIAAIGLVVVLVIAVFVQVFYFAGGPGTPPPKAKSSATPTPTPTAAAGENTGPVPSADLAEGRAWTGTLTLNDVKLGIELDGEKAPQAVASTINLIKSGFYTGVPCHRITTGQTSVLQCGDPTGKGDGGPGYNYGPVENAPADDVYTEGTLAMARVGDQGYSMGSQFFIVYGDSTFPSDSAGGYTVLGKVTTGLKDLEAKIAAPGVEGGGSDGAPAVPTSITAVTVQ